MWVTLVVDIIKGGSLSQLVYDPGTVSVYKEGQTLYMDAGTPVAGIQFTFTQSGEPQNLSGLQQAFNNNLGLVFTLSDEVLLGDGIPILELPEGMEVQDMILVNHLGEVIEALLDVGAEAMVPNEFAVHQNYPNPFNPVTTVQIDLAEQTILDVGVYDLMGRHLAARERFLATGLSPYRVARG